MFRIFLFFMLVYSVDSLAQGLTCAALFESAVSPLSQQTPYPELRAEKQDWDVPEHGLVLLKNDTLAAKNIKTQLSQRDGTYPLIIDSNLHIVIDHRLPNLHTPLDAPYVGNHRGLLARLTSTIGKTPQIVFAGQIRVVGGKAINIIDQSGTFYFKPEDFGFSGPKNIEQLVAKNQERLDQAVDYLIALGIIDRSTTPINFMGRFQLYAPENRNEGHVKAQAAAKFERECRASPSCWNKVLAIEARLRFLVTLGSREAIGEYMRERLPGTIFEKFEDIQLWNMILAEGIIDVLSQRNMLEPNTMQGIMLEKFLISLEHIPVVSDPQR